MSTGTESPLGLRFRATPESAQPPDEFGMTTRRSARHREWLPPGTSVEARRTSSLDNSDRLCARPRLWMSVGAHVTCWLIIARAFCVFGCKLFASALF